MSALKTFLAEAYAPSRADVSALVEQAQRVAEMSPGVIHHLRSMLVRDDETCFHLFEAESIDSLSIAMDKVALRAHRVVEVAS